jgi:hypothetical protein
MIDYQNEVTQTKKVSRLFRDAVRERLELLESNQDIREALQSTSATSYVFQVQGYEWEVR